MVLKLNELCCIAIARTSSPQFSLSLSENYQLPEECKSYFQENIPVNLALRYEECNDSPQFWKALVLKCLKTYHGFSARLRHLEKPFALLGNVEYSPGSEKWKNQRTLLLNMLFHEALHKVSNKLQSTMILHQALGTNGVYDENHFCIVDWIYLLSSRVTRVKLDLSIAYRLLGHRNLLNAVRLNCTHVDISFSKTIPALSHAFMAIYTVLHELLADHSKVKSVSLPDASCKALRLLLNLCRGKVDNQFVFDSQGTEHMCCGQHSSSANSLDVDLYEDLSPSSVKKPKVEPAPEAADDAYSEFEEDIFGACKVAPAQNFYTSTSNAAPDVDLFEVMRAFDSDAVVMGSGMDGGPCELCYPMLWTEGAVFSDLRHQLRSTFGIPTMPLIDLRIPKSKEFLQNLHIAMNTPQIILHELRGWSSLRVLDLSMSGVQEFMEFSKILAVLKEPGCNLTTLRLSNFYIRNNQVLGIAECLHMVVAKRKYSFQLIEFKKCMFENGPNWGLLSERETPLVLQTCMDTTEILSFEDCHGTSCLSLCQTVNLSLEVFTPNTLLFFGNSCEGDETKPMNLITLFNMALLDNCFLKRVKNIHTDISPTANCSEENYKFFLETTNRLIGNQLKLFKLYHSPNHIPSRTLIEILSKLKCFEYEPCLFKNYELFRSTMVEFESQM